MAGMLDQFNYNLHEAISKFQRTTWRPPRTKTFVLSPLCMQKLLSNAQLRYTFSISLHGDQAPTLYGARLKVNPKQPRNKVYVYINGARRKVFTVDLS